jgi:O-antigen/teichoic acid export membrane protein
VLGIGMSVLGFMMLRRAVKPRLPSGQAPASSRGRSLALAGVPFLFAEATLVIYQQIDTIVMSLLVDRDAIGWYATADVLFGSLLFIPVIVTTSLFPAMAERHARDPAEVDAMLSRVVRSLLLVAVPMGLATFIVSRSFVSLLYGPRFEETGPVLEAFGIVVILSSLTIVLGRYALATDRVRFWSVLMFTAIVISIPMDIVLVDWTDRHFDNGALGGALAYIVTEGLMLIVGVIRLAPRLVNRAMVGRLARLAVAGGAMMAVGWPLRSRFFLLSGGASLVAYAVVLLVLSTLDDDERQYAARASRGVRRILRRAA